MILEKIDFEKLIKDLKPRNKSYNYYSLRKIINIKLEDEIGVDIDVFTYNVISVLYELGYKVDYSFKHEVPFFAKPLAVFIILLLLTFLYFSLSFHYHQ